MAFAIDSLDHLVLTVQNIEAACEFYAQVLGMQVTTFANNRYALTFGQQKINLHQAGKEFEPRASQPTPGSADICFITSQSLELVIEHLKANAIEVIEGPVARIGALGAMNSVYFRDPDKNLIEVAKYQ